MKNYRITFKSIGNFDSVPTVVVTYLILPIVSLIMLLLIAFSGNQDYTRILLGSLMDTGMATIIGVIVGSFVMDQNLGVSEEIISIKPKFGNYWLPKILIAFGVMVVEVIVLMLIGLSFLHQLNLLPKVLISLLFFGVIAIILGYISAIAGRGKENPYWLSNFLIGVIIILSGVIIPVTQYPLWLKVVADLFPMSNILNWIQSEYCFNQELLVIIWKLLAWYLVALIFNKIQTKKSR
ncbi:ABC transporter permease [Lactobacillus sp. PV034]|uniref:ABC transporter permease n=1 Tax=Lactobacillus sp. PV034 TaxID=2594495 RepID=UPI00223F43AE|nr:ABC transporter permease [Lactobacillus sp. PV034]QNQ81220.1 ABC transporter permease [Lactobacillus sp. PV034]